MSRAEPRLTPPGAALLTALEAAVPGGVWTRAIDRLGMPHELVWSHLKRSLANLAKRNLGQLTALINTGFRRMQYRPSGRQGSYSPLTWVRIYSPERSPGATAGVYLAYLFAADGSRVYLSLQQGSSEARSGQMRPVSDPAELLARGATARSAIRDLIDSPLGAGMTAGIDLGWRRLSSVGSYSKQRIGNYEYANILAIQYDSGRIPATDTLVADLHRGVALLTALYGDATSAENTGGDDADPADGDWSAAEITAVVDDYMTMLQAEITGQPYSKAGHRRALLPKLHPVRTAGVVEFKHQNISAAMIDLGLPYIRGYKPLSNYQAALTAEIQRHLEANPRLLRTLQDGNSDSALPHGRLQRTPPPDGVNVDFQKLWDYCNVLRMKDSRTEIAWSS